MSRPAAGGWVSGGLLLLLAPLLGLVVAGWPPLLRADLAADRSAHVVVSGSPALRHAMVAVTTVGAPITVDVLVVVFVAYLWLVHRRRAAVVVAASRLASLAVESLIKVTVGRPRPPAPLPLVHASGNSFPSGHATGIAALVVALLLLWPGVVRALAGTLVVVAVGASRVLLGVHYPSDVAAGILVGSAVTVAVWVVVTRWPDGSRPGPALLPWPRGRGEGSPSGGR